MAVEGLVLLAHTVWQPDYEIAGPVHESMWSCSGQAWAVQVVLLRCVSSTGTTSTGQ